MDLYDQNFITRIIFTIASIAIAVGPTIADFNKTHATHPDWPGHARFHVVWQVLGFYPSAIIALIILWSISLFTISLVTTTKESHQEKLSELNYIED